MVQSAQRSLPAGAEILRLALYDLNRTIAREVPLRFVELRGQPHVLYRAATPPEWVSQATGSSLVHWTIGPKEFIGTARAVTDAETLQREILPRARAAFGKERLLRWFGPEFACIALVDSENGVPYYRAVEALFDESAPKYDRVVQGNRFDLHLRKVAIERLRMLFRPGQTVLELGCGTGLETIPLAQSGVNVVALDISSGMLGELERKVRSASLLGQIETRKAPMTALSEMVSEFGPGSFDGAFSHFGALNCEPNLASLPRALHMLVKQDGSISMGIWNRSCLSEMILFGLALRPRRALARFQSSVPVGRSRFGVPVFPYSPGEIQRLFSPFFSLDEAIGVSVLMPPYNLARRFVHHSDLISLLEAGDRLVRNHRFFRYLGDHFLLEMRRR